MRFGATILKEPWATNAAGRAGQLAFATAIAQTRDAPASVSAEAQARIVSPVVLMSSTRRMDVPFTRVDAVKAPRTLPALWRLGNVDCVARSPRRVRSVGSQRM